MMAQDQAVRIILFPLGPDGLTHFWHDWSSHQNSKPTQSPQAADVEQEKLLGQEISLPFTVNGKAIRLALLHMHYISKEDRNKPFDGKEIAPILTRFRQTNMKFLPDAFVVVGDSQYLSDEWTMTDIKNTTKGECQCPTFFACWGKDQQKAQSVVQSLPYSKKHLGFLSSQTTTVYQELVSTIIKVAVFDEQCGSSQLISWLNTKQGAAYTSIKVTVLTGHGLLACDVSGKSDPFCLMGIGKKLGDYTQPTHKTKAKSQTLDPVWTAADKNSHTFKFEQDQTLFIELWDQDALGKDRMGLVKIELNSIRAGKKECSIGSAKKEKASGKLNIEIELFS